MAIVMMASGVLLAGLAFWGGTYSRAKDDTNSPTCLVVLLLLAGSILIIGGALWGTFALATN